MEEALRTFLKQNAGVYALVGGMIAPRVEWMTRPQASALPAIVLSVVSGSPDYVFDGRSGLASKRVSVECWASSYGAAKQLARAVKTAADGLTVVPFKGAFVELERDDVDASDQPTLNRTTVDLTIWHTEA